MRLRYRGGLAKLALIHFGTLVFALSWGQEGHYGELVGQGRDVAEGLILPRQRNTTLPECNNKHVYERLLFKQMTIAKWSRAISHLDVQVSQVFSIESICINLLDWHVDLAQVEGHLFTPELNSLNPLIKAERLQLRLILFDSQLLRLNALFDLGDYFLANSIFLRHCFDNPVVELIIDLTGVNVDFLEDCEGPGVYQGKLVNENVALVLENLSLIVQHD